MDGLHHTAEGGCKVLAAYRICFDRLGEYPSRHVLRGLGRRQRLRRIRAPAELEWISITTTTTSIASGSAAADAEAVAAARFRLPHGSPRESREWEVEWGRRGRPVRREPTKSSRPDGAVCRPLCHVGGNRAPSVGNALKRSKSVDQCTLQKLYWMCGVFCKWLATWWFSADEAPNVVVFCTSLLAKYMYD